MDYYERNADKFIEDTLALGMSALYAPFEKHLTPGSRILDLGCGPGRDLKYFSQKYDAIGLEPSSTLAKYAEEYSGRPVLHSTIQEANELGIFDGIWACASLLHIPSVELSGVFLKLSSLLNPNGVLYCSFKYGNFEGERNGRIFTDLNENLFSQFITNSRLRILNQWTTEDLRTSHQNEKWLNIILSIKL